MWYSPALYRCTEAISGVPTNLRRTLSCDELVALVDRAAARFGERAAGSVRLSGAKVYGTFGRFEDARARVQEVRDRYDDCVLPYIEEGFAYFDRWIADVEAGRQMVR